MSRLVVSLSLLLAAIGCGGPSDAHLEHAGTQAAVRPFAGEHPIKVVCTTGPVADLVRNVGGPLVEVTALMGPGVDPHLYNEKPADMEKLYGADLIVYNGFHLEGQMADVFEGLSARQAVLAVTEGLREGADPRLRRPAEFEGYYDPHVWHDAALWSDCVRFVAQRLGEFDPEHRAQYEKQSAAYLEELAELDQYCREQLATIPEQQRVLVTAHDAFEYFAEAYGLTTEALKGISTDDEVAIGRRVEVVQMLVSQRIPAVFVESAVAHRTIEALVEDCAARGHQVVVGGELYADALGPVGSGADTYVGMVRANVDTIVAALGGAKTAAATASE